MLVLKEALLSHILPQGPRLAGTISATVLLNKSGILAHLLHLELRTYVIMEWLKVVCVLPVRMVSMISVGTAVFHTGYACPSLSAGKRWHLTRFKC